MQIKKSLIMIILALGSASLNSAASAQEIADFGQIINISTHLRSLSSKASWLLIIRDMDHGHNIPFVYDFESGINYWAALTYSRNYVITVSELTFYPSKRKIYNFCNLQSMGVIQHSISMDVALTGRLSPNTGGFNCHVVKYAGSKLNMNALD